MYVISCVLDMDDVAAFTRESLFRGHGDVVWCEWSTFKPKDAIKLKACKKNMYFGGLIADRYESSVGLEISDFRIWWRYVKTKNCAGAQWSTRHTALFA